MWDKLLQLIQNAINKMRPAETNADTPSKISPTTNENLESGISTGMNHAIENWKLMYKDESTWLNDQTGVYSLGIAKQMCKDIARDMLLEVEMKVVANVDDDADAEEGTRAYFLNDVFQNKILKYMEIMTEQSLALGGMILKPYVANNKLYIDFSLQGDFYPIAFNDDGVLVDVAFLDQFTEKNMRYSKVERHIFNEEENSVTVLNSAYVSRLQKGLDIVDLGDEISLDDVARWRGIEPETKIENVEKPLYGYYRVATANAIDLKSPLGVSIFAPAVKMIERADIQFSRLDWEYNGGQLAIDVDPTALDYTETYYGNTRFSMDSFNDRLYRKLDLGKDDTYNAFTPSLRDSQYLQGLYFYLQRIEDLCGLSRGVLSPADATAKTATEINLSKHKSYNTISENQDVLETALHDVMYACEVFTDLYNLAPKGDANLIVEWKDSVLTDTGTELQQRLLLQQSGVLSVAEVRAWYTGEDLEVAKATIAEMEQINRDNMMQDIYTQSQAQNQANLDAQPIEEEK